MCRGLGFSLASQFFESLGDKSDVGTINQSFSQRIPIFCQLQLNSARQTYFALPDYAIFVDDKSDPGDELLEPKHPHANPEGSVSSVLLVAQDRILCI